MNIGELFHAITEELDQNEGILALVRDKYPDFADEINGLLDNLGCDELVIHVSNCELQCLEDDIPEEEWENFFDEDGAFEIQLHGQGRLFRDEEDSSIEMYMQIDSSLLISIGFCYKEIQLDNICELGPTPWNDGSTAHYIDSVLHGIRMQDVTVSVLNTNRCNIHACLDLSACEILAERACDYPFDALLSWKGWVEKPGGEKSNVKLIMESEEFPYEIPFLFRAADEPLEISSGYMKLQTHYADEGELHNYAVEESSDIFYVSYMYKGCCLKSSQNQSPCKMFYTLGAEGAYLEFYSSEEAEELFCLLLGGFEWDVLIREIGKRLGSLFTFDEESFVETSPISVTDTALYIRFSIR